MLLMSTSSLKGYGIHKIFTLVKKMKFDGLDLHIDEKNYDTLDENYLKGLSDAFSLPILSITAPERGITKAKIEKLITMAKVLNTQVITFSPSHMNDKNGDWFYKHLAKVKKDSHLSISIQNVEQKFFIFIIPEYKNNNMLDLKKITGDTTLNIASIDKASGMDLMKMHAILGNSITNVFLSDRAGVKDGIIPGNAGGGVSHLPLESFLMKLKSNAYEGFFTLKVRPLEMGVGDEEKVLYNAEQFKIYFHKHFTNYDVV